jgi:hypothetical protein
MLVLRYAHMAPGGSRLRSRRWRVPANKPRRRNSLAGEISDVPFDTTFTCRASTVGTNCHEPAYFS